MEQAVRTYQESGLPVAEVAKRLSLPKSSLNHWFREGIAVKYRQIESMRQGYPVALMCRALGAAADT